MRIKVLGMITLISLLAMPVAAQADTEESTGKSLMQKGAELFLKGLTDEMEPALDELRDLALEMGPQMKQFFAEMGPAFGKLLEQVDDWSQYEAPEILPNGDIIIRRKPTPETKPEPSDDAIDL